MTILQLLLLILLFKISWKGLNQYYLWQADVPNGDDRFATQDS
jgi:hypothetical protein